MDKARLDDIIEKVKAVGLLTDLDAADVRQFMHQVRDLTESLGELLVAMEGRVNVTTVYRTKRDLVMTEVGGREGWTLPAGSVSVRSYSEADGSLWIEFEDDTSLPLSYVVEKVDFFEAEVGHE